MSFGLIQKALPVLLIVFVAMPFSALAADRDTTRPPGAQTGQVPGLPPGAAVSSSTDDAGTPAANSAGRAAILLNPHQPLVIPRLDTPPKLSDFLTAPVQPAAAEMLRINHFVERYPDDGAKPSNRTIAYIGYTHQALFVAFLCYARDPKMVRAHLMARDSLGDDDHVKVMLDTFHDQRRAFVFETNPRGIQADAMYTEQTGYDFSFDTVWDTWAHRTPWGYALLMRIPFASLYFADALPGELRTWGIVLERIQSQVNEQDYWPRSRHNIAGILTQDMAVEGFADIARVRNKQFEPYVLARNLRQLNTANATDPYFKSKHLQGYAGLDAKFILHHSLVLDTTLNPDFSQVGVNNPASPNQRFPPYFPEVRPFFIENSSYFSTPYNLYYTNNIVTPQIGARLTGKLGPWALGVLGVDDRSPGQDVPQSSPEYGTRAHYYISRIDRDLGSQTDVGVIYADREYLNSFNRAGGIDYRARVRNRWTFTGQAITSETHNISNHTVGEQSCLGYSLSCSGQGYFDQVSYSDLHTGFWTAYTDTAAGYVTDTGFFQRPDVRESSGAYSYTMRPHSGPILSGGPYFYAERIWDHTGLPLDLYFNPSFSLNFKARTNIRFHLSLGQDRLRPIDYSALSDNVEYHSHTAAVNFYSSPVSYLAVGGGYYAGTVINYEPPSDQGPGPVNVASPHLNLEVKPWHYFDLQNSYIYTHFTNLNNGDLVYDNHQILMRWNYQMNPAISVNLIGQYIATLPDTQYTKLTNSKTLFADALFTYMPHPGTAVYFGYIGNFANIDRSLCTWQGPDQCNSNDPILPPGPSLMNDGKTVYLKLSYLLRF